MSICVKCLCESACMQRKSIGYQWAQIMHIIPLFITQSESSFFFPLHMKSIFVRIIFDKYILVVQIYFGRGKMLPYSQKKLLSFYRIEFIQNPCFIGRIKAILSIFRLSAFQDSKSNFECLLNFPERVEEASKLYVQIFHFKVILLYSIFTKKKEEKKMEKKKKKSPATK